MTKKRHLVVCLSVLDLGVALLLCGALAGLFGELAPSAPAPTPTPTSRPTSIPTWTPTPSPSPSPTATPVPSVSATPLLPLEGEAFDEIERQVSKLRGLEPLRPVPRWLITRDQLRTLYVEPIFDEYLGEQLDSVSMALVAFDMLEPGVELEPLVRYFLPNSIAGFYDPEEKGIYIVSDEGELEAYDYYVFAHEYAHALQDQHFDLLTLGFDQVGFSFDHIDRMNALRALIEGDAELVQGQYRGALPVDVERAGAFPGTLALWSAALDPKAVDLGVDPPIDEIFSFPYAYGQVFVEDVYDRGGWEAVDSVYADLPASTEQIMHPELYAAGEEPVLVSVAPLTDTLGAGWRLAFEDPIGEFMLGVYLQNYLGAGEATAAEGWGGDLGVVYVNEATGELVMVLRSAWDAPAEAEEFLDAYVAYAASRYGYPASETAGGLSCWYGEDVLCVTWGGDEVTVVLGPDEATVDAVLSAVSE
jgi:hypothetical protein